MASVGLLWQSARRPNFLEHFSYRLDGQPNERSYQYECEPIGELLKEYVCPKRTE
ncbi:MULTISPECIES: hypothetical protein [Bradyrhizobium]|uniref:hypothetical protein n=1 Tax=Bradyrhizobium TaxID=374 RepID=UPI00041385FE|nr:MULTISPECIES: hypothetical protein [Bradyrhizobium]UFW51294.1 hypothetical protein BaraCB756_09980 [Bradyrhizobium arachidis]